MKKIICIFSIIAMLLVNCNVCFAGSVAQEKTEEETQQTTQQEVLNIQSRSVILIEAKSGKIIYEKNPDEKLRPASVTKIMTLLLIFNEIKAGNMTYEDVVTVSPHAASMGGSQCFFEAGEQQTVRDMIKCIEIASGNDAAVAMGEHIAGSEMAFVQMMNDEAQRLGMVNTHFENACGLEAEGHVTTARDISIMSRELVYNHPEIYEYSTTWMDSIIHKTARGESVFDLANTNKFLNQYTGATGLKTGYTSQAKYCMSATANRNGIELIAVIMGADTKEIRNGEACTLLDYGYSRCKIYSDGDVVPDDMEFKVLKGVKDFVCYEEIPAHEIVVIDQDPSSIEKRIIPYNNITAPIRQGDIIGAVQYSIDGKLIDEVHIIASEDIESLTFIRSLRSMVDKLFMAN